jgi:hypothetical protein
MSAILEGDQAGMGNRLRNVLGRHGGDKLTIAGDDQRWYLEVFELGKQIVGGRKPGVVHEPGFDRSRFENALSALRLPFLNRLVGPERP